MSDVQVLSGSDRRPDIGARSSRIPLESPSGDRIKEY
jgi:hypothetical protein